MKLLFICTQNVFRSFSAQKLAELYIKNNQIQGLEVDSAGTIAYDWESPYSHTIYKLKELGVKNLQDRKNKKISKELLEKNDIIICMTNEHKSFIENNFKLGKKIYLFNELAYGKLTDLEDDDETNMVGRELSLAEFVSLTIENINKGVGLIINNIKKIN